MNDGPHDAERDSIGEIASSCSSYESDQARALLAGDDYASGYTEDGGIELEDRHKGLKSWTDGSKKEKKGWQNLPVWLQVLVLCGIAIILGLGIVGVLHLAGLSPPISPSQAPSKVLTEDYVLDPEWDFPAAPTTREYHWTIQDVDHNPDGVYRPMMLINNQYPGPLIECNEGDTLVVHVDNQAVNATSIHWHGLYQNGTNWMDGTIGITQCPIAPNTTFTYEFKVGGQSGTYWYHSHLSVQASDGLLGPLVIHSQNERMQELDYASDRIVMVQDHYHDLTGALLMHYLEPDRENAEPVPDGALINGRNVRDCSKLPDRRCDNSSSTLSIFNLAPNQNHRLRFINVGAFAEFQVQLDEHEFAVTEVDGTDVHPAYHHRLNILPAQRYSIVINTNVTTTDSFWLRARMVTHCFAEPNPAMEPEARAIIQYTSSETTPETALPQSKDWPEVIELQCRDMNITGLVPVAPIPAPEKAGASLYLRSNFEIGAWKLSRGFFNHSSFRPDLTSPSLHRFIDGVQSQQKGFIDTLEQPHGVNDKAFDFTTELVYQTAGVQTIDIVLSNFDDGVHPFHLHGHKFWVLASGKGYPPANLTDPGVLDLSNPLRRDTASVEAFGWILLRFVADNPGMWAFHCHVSWHAEAGLLMQFLVKAEEVGTWDLGEDMQAMCGAEGVMNGRGPEDSIWYGHPD